MEIKQKTEDQVDNVEAVDIVRELSSKEEYEDFMKNFGDNVIIFPEFRNRPKGTQDNSIKSSTSGEQLASVLYNLKNSDDFQEQEMFETVREKFQLLFGLDFMISQNHVLKFLDNGIQLTQEAIGAGIIEALNFITHVTTVQNKIFIIEKIGNVFHRTEIENAIAKGENYDPDRAIDMCAKSMGIDPGWGSSPFGIVITQFVDKIIQIVFAEEYERPDFEEMVRKVSSMLHKYKITKVYVDGSNPSFISSLKRRMGENPNYEEYTKDELQNQINGRMVVCPINFSQKHRDMLMHTKLLFERNAIAINSRFSKLITSLKTAVENDGSLDKESTAYNDIFDAFRLSLQNYSLKKH